MQSLPPIPENIKISATLKQDSYLVNGVLKPWRESIPMYIQL